MGSTGPPSSSRGTSCTDGTPTRGKRIRTSGRSASGGSMSAETKIEWADHSWSPWEGCSKISPGCRGCYADTLNVRWRRGENWGPGAPRRQMSPAHWREPLRWNAAATWRGVCESVFPSVCDPFDEEAPEGARSWLWALIHATPHLDWLLLTKRPENIADMVPWADRPWANVWLGTSVENQEWADKRIPILLRSPAAKRLLSVEPMLGPVELARYLPGWGPDALIDWVIV